MWFPRQPRPDRFAPYGGDWSLVASLVFKTMDAPLRRVVGSIPIHLRHLLELDIPHYSSTLHLKLRGGMK